MLISNRNIIRLLADNDITINKDEIFMWEDKRGVITDIVKIKEITSNNKAKVLRFPYIENGKIKWAASDIMPIEDIKKGDKVEPKILPKLIKKYQE